MNLVALTKKLMDKVWVKRKQKKNKTKWVIFTWLFLMFCYTLFDNIIMLLLCIYVFFNSFLLDKYQYQIMNSNKNEI